MDLKEATPGVKQGRDVWVLESEAFKDPITIDIAYDDKDKELIEASKKIIEDQVREAGRILQKIEDKIGGWNEVIEEYREKLKDKDKTIENLTKKLEKSEKEKIQILNEVEGIRAIMMSHNEQLDYHTDEIDEIEKKITKEPRVLSGQTFVSGNGTTALTAVKVENGNYIVSAYTKIVEKNEYVENEDVEIGAYNIHISDNQFIPEYELIGTTKLDTPTATVNWTFTLLPY